MDEKVIIDFASGLHGPLARDDRYPQTESVVPPSRTPPLSRNIQKWLPVTESAQKKGHWTRAGRPWSVGAPYYMETTSCPRPLFRGKPPPPQKKKNLLLWGIKVIPIIQDRPREHTIRASKATWTTRSFYLIVGGHQENQYLP